MASIYQRNKIWWISYRQDGKAYNESLKTKDKASAKYLKSQMELKLAEGKDLRINKKIPIKETLDRYLDYLSTKDTEKHAYDQRIKIRQFVKASRTTYLAQIKPQNIEKYLSCRKKEGRKATTLRHDLTALKSFLNWCVYNNLIDINPIAKVKAPRVEKKKPQFLSREEARKLLSVTTGDLKNMILISLYTGIRRGELLRLKWEDFDWTKYSLTIPIAKSGKFRIIPFNKQLKKLLNQTKIPNKGQVFKYSNILRTPYEKALKEAAISLPKNERWHILRHTYASHLVMDGVPMATVSKLLGHANISTTQIYSHLSDKHLEEAGKSVNY